jgi:hypothetical protein
MIFATAAVGSKYINCIYRQKEFLDFHNFDVHILTDKPEMFSKEYTTYKYENTVWSYFDKLTFAFRLNLQHKEDVFFSDGDDIDHLDNNFGEEFKGSKNFLYKGDWSAGNTLWDTDHFTLPYWDPFTKFLKKQNVDPKHILTLVEQHFYIPKNIDSLSILRDLETVKPVLEYTSIMGDSPYPGLGSGEGAGLGYALTKNNIQIEKFNLKYFLNHEVYTMD